MRKQLVVSVMIMSLALVATGCGSSKTVPDTQVTQEVANEVSYNKEVTLGVGEKLSLDMLNIKTDGGYTFDFSEKTYDKIGEYKDYFTYENEKYEFTVKVEDKTAPIIEGTHDIEVTEGESIDLMDGVSTNEGEIIVSDYDASLLDTPQNIRYTATDEAGNTSTKEIQLLIKSNPIESMDKTMYVQNVVNVRAGAGTEYEKLGSLNTNDTVHVIGQDKASSWYQIEYNDLVGYVSNNYLGDSQIVVQSNTSSGSYVSSEDTSSSGGTSDSSSDSYSDSDSSSYSDSSSDSDSDSSLGSGQSDNSESSSDSGGSSSGYSLSGTHTITQDELDAMINDKIPTNENGEPLDKNGNVIIPINIYNN